MNSIAVNIDEELNKRRQLAEQEQEKRVRETCEKIPDLEKLLYEIKTTGIEQFQATISGNSILAEHLSDKLEALLKERGSLLKAHGLDSEYLSVKYSCPICSDRGYIEVGEGFNRCECYIALKMKHFKTNIKLDETFSSFDISLFQDKEGTEGILAYCKEFVDNFDEDDQKNLCFVGSTGTGKTFLCNCIANELLKRGKSVFYQTAVNLFKTTNDFKIKRFKDGEYTDPKYENIFKADLLIIDDLGTEALTTARYSDLLNIIDERSLYGRKVVVSSNLKIKDFHEAYDERLYSRIIGEFQVILFQGEDIRIVRKKNKK